MREKISGSGEWWIFVKHRGKRLSRKVGRDKREAQEAAKKIAAKLVLHDFNIFSETEKEPMFFNYAEKWIETVVPVTCKASTLSDYRGILQNHLKPVFQQKSISQINRYMIKELLMEKLKEGYAQSTVIHIKNALGGIFQLAVDDRTLDFNPAHDLGRVFGKKQLYATGKPEKMDPLDAFELESLLTAFREHFPRHYPLALTLARTGMRVGEAMALLWEDIDFNGRFIKVQRGITRGKISTPKNGKTRRVIMSMHLTETLHELKKQRDRSAMPQVIIEMKPGQNPPRPLPVSEWVFPNAEGNPLDEVNWKKRVFDEALKKAELRKVRVHDLRHSYASILIQAGESLAFIRDQLGHHSIKVTCDVYGHLVPERNIGAVDRLDTLGGTIGHPMGTLATKKGVSVSANSLSDMAG